MIHFIHPSLTHILKNMALKQSDMHMLKFQNSDLDMQK